MGDEEDDVNSSDRKKQVRSFSLSGFYSDKGPREGWDAPMEKYAKYV